MKNLNSTKNHKVRNLAAITVGATIGAPIAVAAALPTAYTFTIVLAVTLPFFTMSCLERAVSGHAAA
jgi:hypothetical protein